MLQTLPEVTKTYSFFYARFNEEIVMGATMATAIKETVA